MKDERVSLGQLRSSFLFKISSLLWVILIITCLDSQLGNKSYAVISVYYLRLDLAEGNNKTQQIETLKR